MFNTLDGFKPPEEIPVDATLELEGRLGVFDKRFIPNLPLDTLRFITKDMKDLKWNKLTDVQFLGKDSCRLRNDDKFCIRKRYIKVATFKHPDSIYGFRMALALEERVPIPAASSSCVRIQRDRLRASVVKASGRFQYDFTQESQSGQVEIEAKNMPRFSSTDVHELAYRMAHLIRGLLPVPIPREITINNTKWPVVCTVIVL